MACSPVWSWRQTRWHERAFVHGVSSVTDGALLADLSRGFRHAYLDYDAADRAVTRVGRGTSRRSCRLTLARAGLPRAATSGCSRSAPIPTASGPRSGSTATSTRPSSPARASRSRSPRTRCALHVEPDALDLPGADARAPARRPVLRRAADLARRRRGVLTTGRSLRSVPRDERVERGQPRWMLERHRRRRPRARRCACRDPGGELVEAREFPGLLVERTLEDEGPFYKVYPEGTIEHFDGKRIPSPYFLGDNPIDLNRNFPWSWAPGARAGRRRSVPGERARGARRRRVRDRASRDLRVAATSTRSAAC